MAWKPEEEVVILPTDDDDWFSPDIASVLRHFEDGSNLVLWPFSRFDSVEDPIAYSYNIKAVESYNKEMFIKTNNYAMRRSFLLTLPQKFRVIHFHTEAYNLLVRDRSDVVKKMVYETLSVCNRHVGSLSYLADAFREGTLQQELSYIGNRERYIPSIPSVMEWSRSYIEAMEDLNEQLRRKFML